MGMGILDDGRRHVETLRVRRVTQPVSSDRYRCTRLLRLLDGGKHVVELFLVNDRPPVITVTRTNFETAGTFNKTVAEAIVNSIKGFFAVIDKLDGMDMATQAPPTDVDASFVLATDNAQGLIAMGAMFSPELMSLDIKPDGTPVEMPLPPISPALSSAFVAMNDEALAIAVGGSAVPMIEEAMSSYTPKRALDGIAQELA